MITSRRLRSLLMRCLYIISLQLHVTLAGACANVADDATLWHANVLLLSVYVWPWEGLCTADDATLWHADVLRLSCYVMYREVFVLQMMLRSGTLTSCFVHVTSVIGEVFVLQMMLRSGTLTFCFFHVTSVIGKSLYCR